MKRETRPLALLASATLALGVTSLTLAQTRPRPTRSQRSSIRVIPLKHISVYDVIAIFGGTVMDGRRNFMNQAVGGSNSRFRPYGSMSWGGYQGQGNSRLGSTVMQLPGQGTQWGAVTQVRANQGLGHATAGAALTQQGAFPGFLQDLGLSLLGWPQTNNVIVMPLEPFGQTTFETQQLK